MTPRRRDSATIKDVAREAGVSYSTVSRALNDSPLVNDRTKRKILTVAKRLNYRPNVHAQGLARGRSHMLGFVVPDLRGTLLMEVVEGAERALAEAGYRALLLHTEWELEIEKEHVEYLRSSRIGGAILCPIGRDEEVPWLRRLAREGFPVVLVDRYFPRLEASHVVTDNVLGGRLATEHLLRREHRSIVCLSDAESHLVTSLADRMQGFRETAGEAGLGPDQAKVVTFDLQSEVPREFPTLRRLLEGSQRPRAIFAVNDIFAMAVYQTMSRMGISSGEIDLVGFDDARMAPFMPLPWSSVAQPKEDIGRRAAQILIEMIDRGSGHIVRESLPPSLIVR
ncbi:LacI family DNA-binding transcriptional regulator [Candidatus Sumerlaeota bacterium]|nr:LacI family DNA-binding transcriptional regulator [Candidatus Sumerlaeota bacterium]